MCFGSANAQKLYGIIIPLPEESLFLQSKMNHKKIVNIDGIQYCLAKINNKNIVFVNSGLGMINSAVVTARLIRDFHPKLILMSGSAGSLNFDLKKYSVVVGKSVVNVDFGDLTKKGVQFKLSNKSL